MCFIMHLLSVVAMTVTPGKYPWSPWDTLCRMTLLALFMPFFYSGLLSQGHLQPSTTQDLAWSVGLIFYCQLFIVFDQLVGISVPKVVRYTFQYKTMSLLSTHFQRLADGMTVYWWYLSYLPFSMISLTSFFCVQG